MSAISLVALVIAVAPPQSAGADIGTICNSDQTAVELEMPLHP